MLSDIERVYDILELTYIDISTKDGLDRLEKLKIIFKEIFAELGLTLDQSSTVLVLMAGSCIEGIALAELYGCSITCIDVQKKLLEKGLRYAQNKKIRMEIIADDVKNIDKYVKKEVYDLILFWGSSLPHIDLKSFDKIIGYCHEALKKGGYVIIDQRDTIFDIILRYKDIILDRIDPPVINIHVSFDPIEGCYERIYMNLVTGDYVKLKNYVWAPFIIEYVLEKNTFRNVKTIMKRLRNIRRPITIAQK